MAARLCAMSPKSAQYEAAQHIWELFVLFTRLVEPLKLHTYMAHAHNSESELRLLIRKATPEDAPALALLLHSIGEFSRVQSETVERTTELLQQYLDQCCASASHSVYIALYGRTTAGYISVHWLPYLFMAGPEGFVSELFVEPQHRGKTIGNSLLNVVRSEAEQRGCSRLHLVNFRSRESYVRQFYAKAGWTERTDAADFIMKL